VELGGVPQAHQTDCLSAAVRPLRHGGGFTPRYQALLRHYGLEARRTQPDSPHENGDVEQRITVPQCRGSSVDAARASRLRGRPGYGAFLRRFGISSMPDGASGSRKSIPSYAPAGAATGGLPAPARRGRRLQHDPGGSNTYSVHSRLIGETVDVELYAEHLDVVYGQRRVDRIPRLRGRGNHRVCYRHVIDGLVGKPGAFAGYRYRDDLFPLPGSGWL